MRTYDPFARKYRSQAFKVARRRPAVRVLRHIPGFFYLRIWHFVFWRDGWRFGVGKEGAI